MAAPIKEIRREEVMKVKLYPDEKEQLKTMLAGSSHPNMSTMVREILFKGEIKVVSIDNDLINRNGLLLQQVRNIGKNFNQLIKLLHSKKLNYFTTKDVNNIGEDIKEIKAIYASIEQYFRNNGS